jgi:hypothetical protein
MSLYDNYRLSNSSAIPQFQGSTGPEAIRVGEYMQGKYDTAEQGIGAIGDASMNIVNNAALEDRGEALRYQQEVNSKLDEFSKRGDLENLVPTVQSLGRKFGTNSQAFYQRAQAQSAFQHQLDEQDKGKPEALTPEQKQIAMAMARYNNGSIRKDANGNYMGTWSGDAIAPNVDTSKIVDEAMKERVISKHGSEWYEKHKDDATFSRGADGEVWMKLGDKTEKESLGKVHDILAPALANHHGYQAAKEREAKFSSFLAGTRINNPEDLADNVNVNGKQVPNTIKQQALELSRSRGISFKDAVSSIAGNMSAQQFEDNTYKYAYNKYFQDDKHTTMEATADPFWLKSTKEGPDEFRVASVGPNTGSDFTGGDVHEDIKKSEKAVADLQEQINYKQIMLDKAKATGQPTGNIEADIDAMKTQMAGNTVIMNQNKERLDRVRDAAVQNMKIDDGTGKPITSYAQLKTSELPKITAEVSKVHPKGLFIAGRIYTAADLSKMIMDNKITHSIQGNITPGPGAAHFASINFTTPEGKTIEIKDQAGIEKLSSLADLNSKLRNGDITNLQKVNEAAMKINTNAIKNFSTTPDAVGLNEEEAKAISHFGIGSGKVYKTPGTMDEYKDSDIQSMEWVPQSYNIQTNRIQGRFKDPVKKTYTDPMEIDMPSNVSSELRTRIIKKSGNDPSWNGIIRELDLNGKDPLKTIQPNTGTTVHPGTQKPLKLSDGTQVELFLDHRGAKPEWQVRKPGTDAPIRRADGSIYRTTNQAIAHEWLQNLSK